MDSHLASVLISGSLDVQNGSRGAEGPEPAAEAPPESRARSSPRSAPGNLQPRPVRAAVAIRRDALSISGKKPGAGGACEPASQEERVIGGLQPPMAAEPGVPAPRSRPIRLGCVVPPQRGGPIASAAISRTKDFPRSAFTSVGTLADKNRHDVRISADGDEEEREEKRPGVKRESFQRREKLPVKRDALNNKVSANDLETSFISSHSSVKPLSLQGIKGERTEERNVPETPPPPPQELDFQPGGSAEEQTEPLDLSLPRKKERRCGRLLDDTGCEGLLIMEVDEYEGEGDRDIVEEDEEAAPLRESLLSQFLSTSVLTSLSLTEEDTEDLLLIDDQGIPYTLTPDGLKVPQVDLPAPAALPPDREDSAEEEGRPSPSPADPEPSRSPGPLQPSAETDPPSPAPAADEGSPPAEGGQARAPELFAAANSGPSQAAEPSFQSAQAQAVPCPSSGTPAPSQPIQIFPNPPANAPLLFLSPSSSSPLLSPAPLGLTLPLAVNQPASCSSTPVYLLLSSVPSSTGESTSTPIAVLDPSTGQLSKIDAASAPVPLPLPPSEVGDLGPPLPNLSHPVIRLTPNNPPVVVPGATNVPAGSVFAPFPPPSSPPALQSELDGGAAVLLRSETNSSIPSSGSQAILGGDAEEASHTSNEPLSPTTGPPPRSPGARSPATEPRFDLSGVPTQHLPLDDHLYFSNPAAASPSPPVAPVLSPGKLDPLDPGSPSSMGPRRVLYCQLCPRVFFYLSDLERHAITHSQKKPHVCQQCGKAFKRSSHLQRHKHIHTGQRNFVCSICAKRFREAGELQRHQRVHTGEKPYQCQLCHTRFAERNTLRRHTKRKHPYHQVAMEMLSEGRGGVRGGGEGGALGMREEEESAEWYSSTVSNLDNSESEGET